MTELQLTVRFVIHAHKLEEFKRLAAACLERTREKDSGTLQYDWFLSADGTTGVLRDRYRDSAAVLEHAANLGELTPALMAVSDVQIEIYGSPAPELLEALAPLGPAVYGPLQSL
jgi:quinol monooxygenase YgiN